MDYRQRIYGRYSASHLHNAAKPPTSEEFDYQARVYRKTFGPHLPEDRSAAVFDMGCGNGAFVAFLRREGYRAATGMDQDADSIATAKRLGVEGASAGDALRHLKSVESRYDCIVAIDIVEHFRKDELFDLTDAVSRALKPGGVFLWRAPNADGPFAGRIRYGDLTHEVAFTKGSAFQLMRCAGFSEVETFAEEPVVTGARSLVRAVLWTLLKLPVRLYLFAESYAQDDCLLTANLIVRARKAP
jgi:SAM-dependent methyltransferase